MSSVTIKTFFLFSGAPEQKSDIIKRFFFFQKSQKKVYSILYLIFRAPKIFIKK